MYKIVYLSQFSNIGGGETILLYLLSKLDRKIFQPVVILPLKGQLSKKLNKMDVTTYYIQLSPYSIRTFFVPGFSFKGAYELYKLVKTVNPDIIHLNHLNLAFYAGSAGKLMRIPVLATAHGPWDSYYFYQDLITNLFVDKILANTNILKTQLTKRGLITDKKVQVVAFGVDLDLFQKSSQKKARLGLRLPEKAKIVTIVGRLDPIKDHLTFLEAASLIIKDVPRAYFFIAGSAQGDFSCPKPPNTPNSYLRSLQKFLLENPSLQTRVIWGEFQENMPDVYNASDVVVSSSLSESFGLSLLEASACAVPVVTTNRGGQKLIIKNGKSGFLVPPKHPGSLAQKTVMILKNPKLQKELGRNGRKFAQQHSLDYYTDTIQNIYLSTMSFDRR